MQKKVLGFNYVIYSKNVACDFYIFCLFSSGKVALNLFSQVIYSFLYILGVYEKATYMQKFWGFVKYIKDPEKTLKSFYIKNKDKLNLSLLDENTIIASSMPEFLIKAAIDRNDIEIISTKVDIKSGKYLSPYMIGEEKAANVKKICQNYVAYLGSIDDIKFIRASSVVYIYKDNIAMPIVAFKPSPIEKFLKRDFLSFVLIGIINSINGIAIAYLYSLILQENIAFIAGYITALFFGYTLNSLLTFKEKMSFNKFIKFCISYIPNFIIQNVFVILFFNILHWPKLLVFALAALISLPITFIILKVFTFKEEK